MIFLDCAANPLSQESKSSFPALWCNTSQDAMDAEFTPPGWTAMPNLFLLYMKVTLAPKQPWAPCMLFLF